MNSFNREKYKPRGGPDGGRGGDGGAVILHATEDLSTLEPYAYRNVVKAGVQNVLYGATVYPPSCESTSNCARTYPQSLPKASRFGIFW